MILFYSNNINYYKKVIIIIGKFITNILKLYFCVQRNCVSTIFNEIVTNIFFYTKLAMNINNYILVLIEPKYAVL